MNFPKRLLLLFLSVHAFPRDDTCVYYTHSPRLAEFSQAAVAVSLRLKALSPKGSFDDFSVMGVRIKEGAHGFWSRDRNNKPRCSGLLFSFYVYKCLSAFMYVYHACAWCLQEVRRGSQSLGTELRSSVRAINDFNH